MSPAEDRPRDPREDEDDHDLLTYTEAGERLKSEIAALEQAVAELGADEVGPAQERLVALRAAASRHGRPSLEGKDKADFYGWSTS